MCKGEVGRDESLSPRLTALGASPELAAAASAYGFSSCWCELSGVPIVTLPPSCGPSSLLLASGIPSSCRSDLRGPTALAMLLFQVYLHHFCNQFPLLFLFVQTQGGFCGLMGPVKMPMRRLWDRPLNWWEGGCSGSASHSPTSPPQHGPALPAPGDSVSLPTG